jgi:hypothetical protein
MKARCNNIPIGKKHPAKISQMPASILFHKATTHAGSGVANANVRAKNSAELSLLPERIIARV